MLFPRLFSASCHTYLSIVLGLVMMTVLSMTPSRLIHAQGDAPAADELVFEDPLPLTPKAWTDPAYGISLSLPTNATMFYPTSNDDDRALAFYYGANDAELSKDPINAPQWHFNLWIKNEAKPREMKDLVGAAKRDLKNATPAAVLIGQDEYQLETQIKNPDTGKVTTSNLPVGMYHYFVPGRKQPGKDGKFYQPRQIYSLVIVAITPSHYLLIYSRCIRQNASTRIPTLKAIIDSLDLTEMATRLQQRKIGLARMAAWQSQFKRVKLEEKLIPQQYFEAYSKNKKGEWVAQGYFAMKQRVIGAQDKSLNTDGYIINIETYRRHHRYQRDNQGKLIQPKVVTGTVSRLVRNEYQQSLDGRNTVWKLDEGTIFHNKGQRPKTDQMQQTGIRNHQIIQIQGTANKKQQGKFHVPGEHYVSQAEQWVLAQFLPRNKAGFYGYYWFDPSNGRVIFCSEEVTPLFGEVLITSRFSYSRRVINSRYNTAGELLERTIHIKPSTLIVGKENKTAGVWVKMVKIDQAKFQQLVKKYNELQKQDNQSNFQ